MLKSCRLHRGKFIAGSLTVKADLATFTILSTAQKKRTRKNHMCIHSFTQQYLSAILCGITAAAKYIYIFQVAYNAI